MDFKTRINNLPNLKVDTINAIAKETCTTVNTVYRWIKGDISVPPLKRKIISKLLGVPESELWPDDEV